MTVINTNIKSLIAQNALGQNSRALGQAMQQLSTGKRINSAADDAAGLAISQRMTAQIRGLDQGVRNANDGVSLLQTTEGALVEVTNMLQRMRELSLQAANDTYTSQDRMSLQLEYAQLMQEINRVAQSTQWNGMNVLNNDANPGTAIGTGGTRQDPSTPVDDNTLPELRYVSFQVGPSASQVISFQFKDFSLPTDLEGLPDPLTTPEDWQVFSGDAQLNDTDISSVAGANTALMRIDAAIAKVDGERATFGAVMNRLAYTVDNLANVSTNTQDSRSRILDADYAKASTELARTQIMQQASTAVLAQANMSLETVLKLLQ
jgi:flagellin